MTLVKPRAVIFDWDNTLVNTWPIIHQALADTFVEMGREPWTFEQTTQRVGQSMRDSFPVLFGDQWQKASELYQANYRKQHLQHLETLPLAEEVLKRVRALGLYSVVVSNKKGPNLRSEVAHMGWNGYFDSLVGANDAARDKPHSDPVHMAFEKSGIVPGPDVWFIGDSEVDLACALETGCTGILYGERAASHADYSQTHYQGYPYHVHVHGHKELLELFK